MNQRRLEALQQMAARGGTQAERQRAKEILERHDLYSHSGALPGADAALRDAMLCALKQAVIVNEMRLRFPRGTRIYYNKWAYEKNCPGVVAGKGKQPWNWLRIKFDNLKQARPCPVYSELGWHISTEPLSDEVLRTSGLREGMDRMDHPEWYAVKGNPTA